jgi:hypothetical protein
MSYHISNQMGSTEGETIQTSDDWGGREREKKSLNRNCSQLDNMLSKMINLM